MAFLSIIGHIFLTLAVLHYSWLLAKWFLPIWLTEGAKMLAAMAFLPICFGAAFWAFCV